MRLREFTPVDIRPRVISESLGALCRSFLAPSEKRRPLLPNADFPSRGRLLPRMNLES